MNTKRIMKSIVKIGIPESAKNEYSGLLTIPKNPVDIADKIIKALTHIDLNEMSRRARQTALGFAWEEIGRKYGQIVKGVSQAE